MESKERKVSTGKGETKKVKAYNLDIPTTLDEAIEIEGGEAGVLKKYIAAYCVEKDGEARNSLCPRSSLESVPETLEGARAKLGTIFAKHGKDAAKIYIELAVDRHPTLEEGIVDELLSFIKS